MKIDYRRLMYSVRIAFIFFMVLFVCTYALMGFFNGFDEGFISFMQKCLDRRQIFSIVWLFAISVEHIYNHTD